MSEHVRATDGPLGEGAPGSSGRSTDDELAERITRALRSRAASQEQVDALASTVESRLRASANAPAPSVVALTRRGGRLVAAGLVTSTLAVAGAGAAAAANPYSGMARAVEDVVQAVGIEWSAMPDGYTREQYEAFWGAGYTVDDVTALSALWGTEATETKARAGQMLLDGQVPPVLAGTSDGDAGTPDDWTLTGGYTQEQYEAFWGAGYTSQDVETLTELWGTGYTETKARAGQMILDGEPVPVPPGGPTPAADPLG